VLDLTDAGGEVFPWASVCCDMGSTLVRPSRWRPLESVAECVAEIAGRAPGTVRIVARMGSLGAAGAQRRASWGGLACEGERRRRMGRDTEGALGRAGRGGEQRVRIAAGPRSKVLWSRARARVHREILAQAKE
jgi:hypothetical protein